jgi:hypothetical protein
MRTQALELEKERCELTCLETDFGTSPNFMSEEGMWISALCEEVGTLAAEKGFSRGTFKSPYQSGGNMKCFPVKSPLSIKDHCHIIVAEWQRSKEVFAGHASKML